MHFKYKDIPTLREKCIFVAKDIWYGCKYILPIIAIPLLYSHFYANPVLDNYFATGDANFQKTKIALEETNRILKIVEQSKLIEYTVPLVQHTIPSPYSPTDDPFTTYNMLFKLSVIPGLALTTYSICYSYDAQETVCEYPVICGLFFACSTALYSIIGLPITYYLAKLVFGASVTTGLLWFTAFSSHYGIIKEICDRYAADWKTGHIEEGETIDKYLNNPLIDIKDF